VGAIVGAIVGALVGAVLAVPPEQAPITSEMMLATAASLTARERRVDSPVMFPPRPSNPFTSLGRTGYSTSASFRLEKGRQVAGRQLIEGAQLGQWGDFGAPGARHAPFGPHSGLVPARRGLSSHLGMVVCNILFHSAEP
jgi:hypothetical protein